jgi:DNA-directed RNA polymerase subunit beta
MAYLDYRNRIKRVDFSKNENVQEIPNLIQVQQESYLEFLQADVPAEKRKEIGLHAVFKGIFPITDYNGRASLEFLSYTIGEPKWSEEECRERGMTFAAPIKVTVQLVIFDVDEKTGARTIRDVKEQEVFFGEIPLMSEKATFIINGTERVIVSQLHRSPGVFFEHDKGRSHASGKVLFSSRIIPYRGSWLDFEFDHKDQLFIKIDRKRKFPIAVLLRAFGRTTEDLLRTFYDVEEFALAGDKCSKDFRPELVVGLKMLVEVRHPDKAGEIAFKKGVKVSKKRVERYAREGVKFGRISLPIEDLVGKVVVSDVADPATGEVLLECGQQITAETLETLREKKVQQVSAFTLENSDRAIWEGLVTDKIRTREEALKEIYKKMRPGDPPTKEAADSLFTNMFFNPERYSLSRVGRLKLNHKIGLTEGDLENTVLTQEDILRVIRYLIGLKNGVGEADDIDNLGNRRVRTVGELIENQFRMGLVRVERAIREKMGLQDIETLMPHDIINAKPVSAVIKEFFGSSQLSQFMDQRTGGVRSPRRPPDPLRPDLPDRDAGRAEHRPDRIPFHVRPDQRVRVHRDPIPGRQGFRGYKGDRIPLGDGGRKPRHRPGERRGGQEDGQVLAGYGHRPAGRGVRHRAVRRRHPHGRVPEPARLRGGIPRPVPRTR